MGKFTDQLQSRRRGLIGIWATALTAVFALVLISLLSGQEKRSLVLADYRDQRHDWSYEILAKGQVRQIAPAFADDYTLELPAEAEAVRIDRKMTETWEGASLRFLPAADVGIDVFLEDELLYSDFGPGERAEDGFLRRTDRQKEQDWLLGREIWLPLPQDYTGKTLTVISYFAKEADAFSRVPQFPMLEDVDTATAPYVVRDVIHLVMITLYLMLALLLCGMYQIGTKSDFSRPKIFLLTLTFLLEAVDQATHSMAGTSSGFSFHLIWTILGSLSVCPLLIYVALALKNPLRRPMVLASAVLSGAEAGHLIHMGLAYGFVRSGLSALIMVLLIGAAFGLLLWTREAKAENELQMKWEVALFFGILLLCLLYEMRASDGTLSLYVGTLIRSFTQGDCDAFVNLMTLAYSLTAACLVVIQIFRQTMLTQRRLGMISRKEQNAQESVAMMRRAEEETRRLRHEMRHRLIAVEGLLKEGKVSQAQAYIQETMDMADALPPGIYSHNLTVNAIVGYYFSLAKEKGIRVEQKISIPAQLAVEDGDLCILLTNMLENAVESCERQDEGQERYIRFRLTLEDHILYAGCRNSVSAETAKTKGMTGQRHRTSKADRKNHGFGISAMEGTQFQTECTLNLQEGANGRTG